MLMDRRGSAAHGFPHQSEARRASKKLHCGAAKAVIVTECDKSATDLGVGVMGTLAKRPVASLHHA